MHSGLLRLLTGEISSTVWLTMDFCSHNCWSLFKVFKIRSFCLILRGYVTETWNLHLGCRGSGGKKIHHQAITWFQKCKVKLPQTILTVLKVDFSTKGISPTENPVKDSAKVAKWLFLEVLASCCCVWMQTLLYIHSVTAVWLLPCCLPLSHAAPCWARWQDSCHRNPIRPILYDPSQSSHPPPYNANHQ